MMKISVIDSEFNLGNRNVFRATSIGSAIGDIAEDAGGRIDCVGDASACTIIIVKDSESSGVSPRVMNAADPLGLMDAGMRVDAIALRIEIDDLTWLEISGLCSTLVAAEGKDLLSIRGRDIYLWIGHDVAAMPLDRNKLLGDKVGSVLIRENLQGLVKSRIRDRRSSHDEGLEESRKKG
jgi:hypothetical protein